MVPLLPEFWRAVDLPEELDLDDGIGSDISLGMISLLSLFPTVSCSSFLWPVLAASL